MSYNVMVSGFITKGHVAPFLAKVTETYLHPDSNSKQKTHSNPSEPSVP